MIKYLQDQYQVLTLAYLEQTAALEAAERKVEALTTHLRDCLDQMHELDHAVIWRSTAEAEALVRENRIAMRDLLDP